MIRSSILCLALPLVAAAACSDKLVLDANDGWPSPTPPKVGAAGMVLVTNSGDDSVSWIDPGKLEQVFKMPVGFLPPEREGPHHGAVAADGKSFFVGLSNYVPGSGSGPHGSHGLGTVNGSLLKYDVATAELIGDVTVDKSPGDVRLTPDGKWVLQTHYDLKKIQDVDAAGGTIEDMYAPLAIIDAQTLALEMLPVCPAPHGVQVAADSKTAYVACSGSDELAVVDLGTRQVTRFPVGTAPIDPTNPTYGPYAVSVQPGDGTVWVSDLQSKDLRVFVPTAMAFHPPIVLSGAPLFGQFAGDGSYFFVPVQAPDAFVVVEALTGHVVGELPFAAADCRAPHAVLLASDEKSAFVVCEGNHSDPGSVAIVDLSDPQTPVLKKSIPVGVFPDDAFFLKGTP
jgi:DNA-binding beta-propeller fold protein YncE